MRISATLKLPRLRSVTAVAVALWLVAGAFCCDLVRSESSASDPVQAVLTSGSGASAVNADQARGDCDQSQPCPRAIAAALLPDSATARVALWTTVAVATVAGSLAYYLASTTRGPPRRCLIALTGQDLLTRFCLARC